MSPSSGLRDQAAIIGVGYSPISSNSGLSTTSLAVEAITNAVADAGISIGDVDGLAAHSVGDSITTNLLANALGIRELRYFVDQNGGGSVSLSIVGQAALAVAMRLADYVVCYRALNARSGVRMGRPLGTAQLIGGIEKQFKVPYGFVGAPLEFAMAARTHMMKYGTTSEQFGRISVSQRWNASKNPRALKRMPITLDDYFNSRWIAEPLRLLDCCLESDGACALVVTSKERARAARKKPVHIGGAVWGGGYTLLSRQDQDPAETIVSRSTARRLYAMAGVGPEDIDIAELYDCFTYTVLVQLEDYGFCAKGEGGPFVDSGSIELNGSLPVNTHGGFLSEGYLHGLNHVAEAVLQLRGECGERQVQGAEVALATSQPGLGSGYTSALILHK